jgi:hypothetical protein
MIFKPTSSKRNVVLAPRFVGIGTAQLKFQSTEIPKVARISAFFVDHESITEGVYNDKDEATLLRQFWQAIRASDRIFAADVEKTMSLIRRRTWHLDLIPSPEIDLRTVYFAELWDTQRMWSPGEFRCRAASDVETAVQYGDDSLRATLL